MRDYRELLIGVKEHATRASLELFKSADAISLVFRNYEESVKQVNRQGRAALAVYQDYFSLGPNLIERLATDLEWTEDDVQSAQWCGEMRFKYTRLRNRDSVTYSVLSKIAHHPEKSTQEELVQDLCAGVSLATIKRQLSAQESLRQFYIREKRCHRCDRRVEAPDGLEIKHIGSSERKFFCKARCQALFYCVGGMSHDPNEDVGPATETLSVAEPG